MRKDRRVHYRPKGEEAACGAHRDGSFIVGTSDPQKVKCPECQRAMKLGEDRRVLPQGKGRAEVVWDQIEKFVSEKPKFFITMTAINKVGINPKFAYGNPVGVYCYQLSPDIFEQLKTFNLPFVADQPYLNVLSVSGKITYIDNYSESSYNNDVEILRKEFDGTDEEFEKLRALAERPKGTKPFRKIWQFTNQIASHISGVSIHEDEQKRTLQWRRLLLMLGMANIVDPGLEIIHPFEPEQSLLMDVSEIKLVKTFLNPYASKDRTELADPSDVSSINNRERQKKSVTKGVDGKVVTVKNGVVRTAWEEDDSKALQVRPGPSVITEHPDYVEYEWSRPTTGDIKRIVRKDGTIHFSITKGRQKLLNYVHIGGQENLEFHIGENMYSFSKKADGSWDGADVIWRLSVPRLGIVDVNFLYRGKSFVYRPGGPNAAAAQTIIDKYKRDGTQLPLRQPISIEFMKSEMKMPVREPVPKKD